MNILIADSGSTKTDWRIITPLMTVSVKTVGFNPYYQDANSIANELTTNLLPHFREPIHKVYYYGTGVTNDEKAQVITDAISAVYPTAQHLEAHSDVVGAARALCGHQAGIACIMGTGSNSCYFDGEKIAFQIPPLGFWLGDEGSGGHLGKTLILSYLHKEMPIEIREKFEEKFGVLNRLTIIENAYQKPFPNRYFASFSIFLHDNLTNDFCKNLVENCMKEFFDKYLCKYPMKAETTLNFVGSIAFYYREIIEKMANNKGFNLGKIIKNPIDGLEQFHHNR